MLPPDELLDAIAASLRHQVGPAVADPFAKTQAFMAAVILQKLAGQLRAPGADVADERRSIVADVRARLGAAAPAGVMRALDALDGDGGSASWRAIVEALYAEQEELGAERFDIALATVRGGLRARLDRALAYAS